MQQFQIKWNNHLNIFSSALSKYFHDKKFLDVILVVENGNHMIQCHKIVLDACSQYFSNIFKSKLLEEKNIVICLPKEIELWEIQAVLNYMYNGEVCISQDGLKSLVKCAEILQVKGLCGVDSISERKINSNDISDDAIIKHEISIDEEETEIFETDCVQSIVKEKDISQERTTDHAVTSHLKNNETENFLRVKKNLFNKEESILERVNVPNNNGNNLSSSINRDQYDAFENIICSPSIFMENDKESIDTKTAIKFQSSKNVTNPNEDEDQNMMYTNDVLYDLISKKMTGGNLATDTDGDCNLMISSVNSLNDDANTDSDAKKSIAGLYLRNPRGNQIRQYDVNALYSALEDVRNGVSIYRAAQTYSIPRKTLRNWMKRLHIKSHFPMPKQLAKAAEKKKSLQNSILIDGMDGDNPFKTEEVEFKTNINF
ncbi:hypothetical protein ACKWTF_007327 [Chironomus riparius]